MRPIRIKLTHVKSGVSYDGSLNIHLSPVRVDLIVSKENNPKFVISLDRDAWDDFRAGIVSFAGQSMLEGLVSKVLGGK